MARGKGTKHLKEIREKELLSMAQLARLSAVDARTISRLEKGETRGTELTRRKLLKGYNSNPNKTQDFSYEDLWDI